MKPFSAPQRLFLRVSGFMASFRPLGLSGLRRSTKCQDQDVEASSPVASKLLLLCNPRVGCKDIVGQCLELRVRSTCVHSAGFLHLKGAELPASCRVPKKSVLRTLFTSCYIQVSTPPGDRLKDAMTRMQGFESWRHRRRLLADGLKLCSPLVRLSQADISKFAFASHGRCLKTLRLMSRRCMHTAHRRNKSALEKITLLALPVVQALVAKCTSRSALNQSRELDLRCPEIQRRTSLQISSALNRAGLW